MKTTTADDGCRIAYADDGDGFPVLLLPPTAADHMPLMGQAAALGGSFRTIAVDHRGTGGSDRPDDGYTGERLARDALAVLDAEGIGRTHVLGLSMGSAVAQELALLAPERIDKLVLLNTWGRTDAYMDRLLEGWQYLAANAPLDVLGRTVTWALFSPAFLNVNLPMVDVIVEQGFAGPQAPPRQAQVGHMELDRGHDTLDRLPSIEAPTLVVTGERDRAIPPAHAQQVADALPKAELHVLEGPGAEHGLFVERAPEVNDVVLRFLKA